MATKSQNQVNLEPADLDVILHGGLVLTGKLKDLAELRQRLKQDPRFRVVYTKFGAVPLYVVTEAEFLLLNKLEGKEE